MPTVHACFILVRARRPWDTQTPGHTPSPLPGERQAARGVLRGNLNRRNRWRFRRVGVLSRYAQNSPRVHSPSAREPLAAMRGTRGEAPHPGRVTGVSMFISTFLFLVVVSEYRHQWLRYARPVWQVVGGECPASGVGVLRLCVPSRPTLAADVGPWCRRPSATVLACGIHAHAVPCPCLLCPYSCRP